MEGFKAQPTLHKIDGTTRLLRSALQQQPPKLENDAHSVTDECACFNTEKKQFRYQNILGYGREEK